MRRIFVQSLWLLPCIAPVLDAQGRWTLHATASAPQGRTGFQMTTDIRRGVAVMFGGFAGARLNDTWEWNGSAWIQRSPITSPPPRDQYAMAYDLLRGVTLLFGGMGFGDTWQYDGATWTQRTPMVSPSARCCSHMAFDVRRGRMVLFGGYDSNRGLLDDTWEWDGTNWTQVRLSNQPSPRCCGSMVYDMARGVCVLFGGTTTLTTDTDETWEYDGASWTLRAPPVRPAARRGGNCLAYDARRGRCVLFGGGRGISGNPSFQDTWEWDGAFWVERSSAARPTARFLQGMSYLWNSNEVLMFGGYEPSNIHRFTDTWTYTATNTAQCERYGAGCAGTGGTPNLDRTNGGPWLGLPFTMRSGSLPRAGAAALFLGSSNKAWGAVPLPLKLDSIGMTNCGLLAGPDVVVPASIVSGNVDWLMAIPNVASLVGFQFFAQAFVFDGGANTFGATLSNGLAATVGDA